MIFGMHGLSMDPTAYCSKNQPNSWQKDGGTTLDPYLPLPKESSTSLVDPGILKGGGGGGYIGNFLQKGVQPLTLGKKSSPKGWDPDRA